MTVHERPEGTPERLLPPISEEARPFWDATRERRLLLQRCRVCDRAIHFPRAACPGCFGSDLGWRESTGGGAVHAVTIMPTPASPTMAGRAPYAVALVDLDDGVRLLTNLVGERALDAAVGDRVELRWEPLEDGRHLPVFEPVTAGGTGSDPGRADETGVV